MTALYYVNGEIYYAIIVHCFKCIKGVLLIYLTVYSTHSNNIFIMVCVSRIIIFSLYFTVLGAPGLIFYLLKKRVEPKNHKRL